jgi:hypothetical protein
MSIPNQRYLKIKNNLLRIQSKSKKSSLPSRNKTQKSVTLLFQLKNLQKDP